LLPFKNCRVEERVEEGNAIGMMIIEGMREAMNFI
jgi:hypothetical protein